MAEERKKYVPPQKRRQLQLLQSTGNAKQNSVISVISSNSGRIYRVRRPVTRKSNRLICFKKVGKSVKVLLVQRPYTYQRSSIVAGGEWYMNHTDSQAFINKMTRQEQVEMLDPKFDFCAAYKKCYRKKLNDIARRDANEADDLVKSAHLEFVSNMQVLKPYFEYGISHNINGSLPWSFPGGGFRPGEYSNSYNTCLAIAMRETEEETKLTPNQYQVLDINSQSFRYEDDGVEYDTECFFAVAKRDAVAYVDVNDEDQTDEVGEVKWMSYEELSALKLDVITRDYVLKKIREYKWVYETYESRTFDFRSINNF